jgi:ATP-dependent DNA helicase RecQ
VPGIHSILKTYWGFDQFRPLQQEIIEAVLNGHDTLGPAAYRRRQIALLPGAGPGAGRHLPGGIAADCMMKDQIENLRSKGIMALGIYSGMSRRQIAQTLKECGVWQLQVSCTCRRSGWKPALFLEFLPALQVSLIAVG